MSKKTFPGTIRIDDLTALSAFAVDKGVLRPELNELVGELIAGAYIEGEPEVYIDIGDPESDDFLEALVRLCEHADNSAFSSEGEEARDACKRVRRAIEWTV